MKVGIAGTGVIGGTLERWFRKFTTHEILAYDPPMKREDDLSSCVALMICVPVPTVNQHQDLTIVEEVIARFGTKEQKIFVRSSVLPGTCDFLSTSRDLNVFAMPEFLTERESDSTMEEQDILCGGDDLGAGHYRFLAELFACQKGIVMASNTEAEMAKYMHNGNGTVKVAFNNKIYAICQKMGLNYERVRAGALMSGYVNKTHTTVPGPDGMLGYGGKCFPKDMDALIGLMREMEIPCESLEEMQKENRTIRKPIVV